MTPILAKLDELKALADKATPDCRVCNGIGSYEDEDPFGSETVACYACRARNQELARTAMPQLVEAIRVLLDSHEGLLGAIEHGDKEHRCWLKNKIDVHFEQALTRIQAILDGVRKILEIKECTP